MNITEKYLSDVMKLIQGPPQEVKRIESDLKNHLQDLGDELGEELTLERITDRMGRPEEVAEEFMAGIKLHYAGFFSRALAFVIDMAAHLFVAGFFILPALFFTDSPMSGFSAVKVFTGIFAFSLVLTAAGLMILYFPILEGRYGTTLGKYLLNLHVVKENGAPIGYKEAFLRRIPYYFEFLVVDVLFIPFTEKNQRAFDLIARTVVIRNV